MPATPPKSPITLEAWALTRRAGNWSKNTLAYAGRGYRRSSQSAYEFLANNYESDDYVYIFGFSRGAAAARSLSGLTELFGVLPKSVMDCSRSPGTITTRTQEAAISVVS